MIMGNINFIIFCIFSSILGLILIINTPKNNDPTLLDSNSSNNFIIYLIWISIIIAITLLIIYIFNKYVK